MSYSIGPLPYPQILNQTAKGHALALLAAASGTQKKVYFFYWTPVEDFINILHV